MARFFQPIQQQVVRMDTPVNVDFYANLLNQAQGNLEKGTAMQAKFLEDAYGQKYLDEATRNAQINKAQELIKNSLESEFVSPSRVGRDVIKASQQLAPWKNLNERQLELAKTYEEDKRRLGFNMLATQNPAEIKLSDEEGNLINPDKLKYSSMNVKDIYDNFGNIYGANLLNTIEGKPTSSGIPFVNKITTTKGLTKEQKIAILSPGTKTSIELASKMMDTNPILKENLLSIYGDYDKAFNALQEFNLKASFDDKYARTEDSKYIDDKVGYAKWVKSLETPTQQNRLTLQPSVAPENIDKEVDNKLAEWKAKADPKKYANEKNSGFWAWEKKMAGTIYGPLVNAGAKLNESLGFNNTFLGDLNESIKEGYTPEKVAQEYKKELGIKISEHKKLYERMSKGKDGNGTPIYKTASELNNAFMENAAQLEKATRAYEVNKIIISPSEFPKLYEATLVPSNKGFNINEVDESGKIISDEGISSEKMLTKEGKLKGEFQSASTLINPNTGNLEISDPKSKKIYAIDKSRLDPRLSQESTILSEMSTEYKKLINDGYGTEVTNIALERIENQVNVVNDILKALYGKKE